MIAFLVSTKVPILPVGAEDRAGPQVGERSDGGAGADDGERRVRARDRRALADLAVEEGRVRADRRAGRDDGRAADLRAGQDA